jgi:hypothetical protein
MQAASPSSLQTTYFSLSPSLFRQLVILIRDDSFCFVNNKKPHPVSSATNYKRRFAETQRANCQAAVWKRVDIRSTISRKTWMGDREKYVVC